MSQDKKHDLVDELPKFPPAVVAFQYFGLLSILTITHSNSPREIVSLDELLSALPSYGTWFVIS